MSYRKRGSLQSTLRTRYTPLSGISARQIHASRSQRARLLDERLRAPLAKSVAEWARNPNRLDLEGIDYPKGTKPSESKPSSKHDEDLKYALYVLKNSPIRPNEEQYYRGLTGKNPHGIDDAVWREANKQVTIRVEASSENSNTFGSGQTKSQVQGSTSTYNKATGWLSITFDSIPSLETRNQLKSQGFRYVPYDKRWRASYSPDREAKLKEMSGSVEQIDIKPDWAAKAEHAADMAEKHVEKSNEAYERSSKIADAIPFGQPILVGHHSERHHRADLERIRNGMDKSVEERKIAESYQERAERYGRKAPLAKSREQWVKTPNRYDLKGVDYPENPTKINRKSYEYDASIPSKEKEFGDSIIRWWEALPDGERTKLMNGYTWHGTIGERHQKLLEMFAKYQRRFFMERMKKIDGVSSAMYDFDTLTLELRIKHSSWNHRDIIKAKTGYIIDEHGLQNAVPNIRLIEVDDPPTK